MSTNATILPSKKLLDQVREKIRYKHYSLSTEKTDISWIKHDIIFHGKRHPADMGAIKPNNSQSGYDNLNHVPQNV